MKPIRIAGIAAAALAALSLAGCWDSYDLEKNRYVSGVGFDKADGQNIIYAQMLDLTYLAKQEMGKSESPAVIYIGKGQGPTLNMAANHLYQTAQQRVLWSHVTSIVVTEAALKDGMEKFEDAFDRFRDTRYTQWVYGSRDDIETLFKTTDFFNISALTTILHDPESNYNQLSWIKPIRWVHFFADIMEPGKTVVLPTLGVNRNQWKRNGESTTKLQVDGAFILGGKSYKGWLNNEQLRGLRWMTPGTKRTPLPIAEGSRVLGVLSVGGAQGENHRDVREGSSPLPNPTVRERRHHRDDKRGDRKGDEANRDIPHSGRSAEDLSSGGRVRRGYLPAQLSHLLASLREVEAHE